MKSKPWSGRFTEDTNQFVEEFTASIPFDKRLYRQDIIGSIAHAIMLGDRGIMTHRSSREDDVRSFFTIDSFAGHVVDPVGAGDALLAYATLSLRASGSPVIASILATMAAGA